LNVGTFWLLLNFRLHTNAVTRRKAARIPFDLGLDGVPANHTSFGATTDGDFSFPFVFSLYL